jgi:hypothetical protein
MSSSNHDLLRKYLYYFSPKDLVWIFYNQFNSIFKTVENPPSEDAILYVYAIHLDGRELLSVFQTKDKLYHLLHNNRVEPQNEGDPDVESTYTHFNNLGQLWEKLTKSQRERLRIPRKNKPEFKTNSKKLSELPDPKIFQYLDDFENASIVPYPELLPTTQYELNLENNPFVTSHILKEYSPPEDHPISKLTLTNCVKIEDFQWCHASWAQDNLEHLILVSMYGNSKVTPYHLKYLVDHLPKLKRISFHRCGVINLTALLGLLGTPACNLESIILDNPTMLCQGNSYSGVISEEQWLQLKNTSLKSLYINSNNVSVDIIDFIRKSCKNLTNMMLCKEVYDRVKQNMAPPDNGDESEEKITYYNLDEQVKMSLPRNFKLNNLLKNKFQSPFSSAMLSKIEQLMGEDAVKDLK